MKNLLIITAATIALASPAIANDLSFGAYGEYALEAESLEFGLGADYVVGEATFSADLTVVKFNGESLDLDSLDLSAAYAISNKSDIYATITLDSDLKYTETVVGIAVKF